MQNLFSYPIAVDELSSAARKYEIKATPKDLEYLAEVLKVPSVKNCVATLWLRLNPKEHKLSVSGKLKAALELQSVVSLEFFEQKYDSSFELLYDTKATYKDIREMEPDYDDDVPDIIIGGQLDLGEVVIEQVALLIDDYPRREGEVFDFESEFDEETDEQLNPFNILKKLKK